ncbi:unnamed protein product [Caenorhabditis brenneri]
MSEPEDDATQTTREEDVLSYEIYFWIVRSINEKGVVKLSDLRKLYQKSTTKDKTVQIRPLQEILKLVNDNLLHFQGWSAVMQDDRITYVNLERKMTFNLAKPSETERILGLLEITLMYIFVAIKPSAKSPGVTHDELMAYLEATITAGDDHKLSQVETELLKKLISPNARAEFVKKGYISYSKSVENDEEVFRYEWGPTSRQSVDPVQLVQMFQKMTGMDSNQLKEQFKRAAELKAQQSLAIEDGVVLMKRGQIK